MNYKEILTVIEEINLNRFRVPKRITPANWKLVDKIFSLGKQVEPCDAYRNGEDRVFWLRSGEVWFKLYLAEFNEKRSVWLRNKRIIDNTTDNLLGTIDIEDLLNWILGEEEKSISMIREGTYTEYIRNNLPYRYRSGVVSLKTYWKYVPEDKVARFKGIDPDELAEFMKWNKEDVIGLKNMTSGDYLKVCDYLYDLLELKEKYPILKKGENTPREYYLVYAANYSSSERFLSLDPKSPNDFKKYLSGYVDHHVWEVCCAHNMHLYPKIIDGHFYLELCSESFKSDDLGLMIHLQLAMRNRGFPMIKPEYIEKELSGEILIRIVPQGDNYDGRYAYDNSLTTSGRKLLPSLASADLINEITWFPIRYDWRMIR